ncbi:MAG TPA: glycosyltransferase [Solirubrobacteraceae bacterium]|nr:glycosyltransferase [Solirubrobacteraceae bacterium]
MRVLVLAEYYPRATDPVLGVWAHRQTVAARDAGADVRVLVLHRPLPPLAAVRRADLTALRRALAQPPQATLDGVPIQYLSYLSPPRPISYASWGAWAARPLRRATRRLHADFPFDLIHAHYAVPAGDAARRACPAVPTVVSVHGGDVLGPHADHANVAGALRHARIVLANSAGTARRCAALGARSTRVVHLGADPELIAEPSPPAGPSTPTEPSPPAGPSPPTEPSPPAGPSTPTEPSPPAASSPPVAPGPSLVTVGNLIARKRHAQVIAAVAQLAGRHPGLRYEIVGDGPERDALLAQARALGIADRVRLHGARPHADAVAIARRATLFVMPSVAEAFGVAYVEAMAGGVPAVGCRGEDGPEEIARAGGGIVLVAPDDGAELTATLSDLLDHPDRRAALAAEARATVAAQFTWARCGIETVRAYEAALA